MRLRTVFVLVVLLLLGAIAGLNWAALTASTPLSLVAACVFLFALGLETATLLESRPNEAARDVIARLERLEESIRAEVERAGNTLAAYIGEIEQRLEAGIAQPERTLPRATGGRA